MRIFNFDVMDLRTEQLAFKDGTVQRQRHTIMHLFISNGTDKPDCKKCLKALQELENIDDEADQLGIGFVKIADEELADEYNLGSLPALVYYRHQIPIIYESKYVSNA